MRKDMLAVMKAVVICFKPYLKPEEARLYCNLEHTQFAQRTAAFGIYKNDSGYYKREDLDLMMSGIASKLSDAKSG